MSVVGDIFLGLFFQNWIYLVIGAVVILTIMGRFTFCAVQVKVEMRMEVPFLVIFTAINRVPNLQYCFGEL